MEIDKYYTAPDQKIFDEIKKAAIEIWSTYDDTFGYRTGKLNRIKDLENFSDNAWYIVQMFDPLNKRKLLSMVSNETCVMIMDALEIGEDPDILESILSLDVDLKE